MFKGEIVVFVIYSSLQSYSVERPFCLYLYNLHFFFSFNQNSSKLKFFAMATADHKCMWHNFDNVYGLSVHSTYRCRTCKANRRIFSEVFPNFTTRWCAVACNLPLKISNVEVINHVKYSGCMLWPVTDNKKMEIPSKLWI